MWFTLQHYFQAQSSAIERKKGQDLQDEQDRFLDSGGGLLRVGDIFWIPRAERGHCASAGLLSGRA